MIANMERAEIDYRCLTEKALMAYSQIDNPAEVLVRDVKSGIYYTWDGMYRYDEIGTIEDVNTYYEELYGAYGVGEDED